MHLPKYHAEHRLPVLHDFIRQHPLGILTTAIKSSDFPLLQISHIPWVLDSATRDDDTSYGKLRGHLARQNPQAKAIVEHVTGPSSRTNILEEDVLVVFNADIHHYVPPKFYVETKPTTGKVVPTWDYEAVQVYGRAKVYVDSQSEEVGSFLTTQIADLSLHMESSIMGHGRGTKSDIPIWSVSDAPSRYISLLQKNIIGIEIEITSISGRFKMSQEKNRGDRDGVIEGMRGLDADYGVLMADMIRQRAREYDESKDEKDNGV